MGTNSEYAPAIALSAESSPTPKVVTNALIPLTRAYPSAAYPAIASLDFLSIVIEQIDHTRVEFIAVAHPLQSAFWQVIQGDKIVVTYMSDTISIHISIEYSGIRKFLTGNTMHRTDSNLMEPPEEVFGDINGLAKLSGCDIVRHDVAFRGP